MFLVWAAFAICAVVFKIDSDTISKLIPWFGGVSIVYVGAQAVVDVVEKLKPILDPYIKAIIKAKTGVEIE